MKLHNYNTAGFASTNRVGRGTSHPGNGKTSGRGQVKETNGGSGGVRLGSKVDKLHCSVVFKTIVYKHQR